MTYNKTTWTDDNLPDVTAAQLNRMEQGIADAHSGLSVPVVSTLPLNPYDGQEVIYYPTAPGNPGTRWWRCRYRMYLGDGVTLNTSDARWEVMGGMPIVASTDQAWYQPTSGPGPGSSSATGVAPFTTTPFSAYSLGRQTLSARVPFACDCEGEIRYGVQTPTGVNGIINCTAWIAHFGDNTLSPWPPNIVSLNYGFQNFNGGAPLGGLARLDPINVYTIWLQSNRSEWQIANYGRLAITLRPVRFVG